MEQRRITEPSRTTPVFGDYEVVVLGGGPAGIIAAVAAAGRCGRSTILIERYGFLGGAGTAAGLSTFCGLHANVHGEHRQVVHGFADDFLARIDRLDGLNAAHLSFANRITGASLRHLGLQDRGRRVDGRRRRQLLFHAFGVGAVMRSARGDRGPAGRDEIGPPRDPWGRCSSIARATAISPPGRARPMRKATATADMLYPSTMFRINGVDPAKAGRPGRSFRG